MSRRDLAARVLSLAPDARVVDSAEVELEPSELGDARVVPVVARTPSTFAREYADVWRAGSCALVVNPELPDARREAMIARLARARAPGVGHVLCTSGTTRDSGIPAAFFFRAERAQGNARAHLESVDIDVDARDERFLLPTPVWHSFGVVAGLLGAAAARGDLYAFTATPDPSALVHAADTHRITTLYANPTLARLLLRSARRRALPALAHLRRVSIGSATLTRGELLALMTILPNVRFYFTYGLTEMGPRVATFAAGSGLSPHALLRDEPARPVPIGRAIDGVTCTLAKGNAPARLAVTSRYAADGEWTGDESRALPSTADGFVTEDAAALLPSGDLEVLGRVDETIVTGGLNVMPDDVERAALAAAGIAHACAVGVPSDLYGEIVVLGCELAPGHLRENVEPALEVALRAALAPAALPKAIHFVDMLPRTTAGKPLRREVRALLRAKHGAA